MLDKEQVKAVFLAAYEQSRANMTAACKVAQVSQKTISEWRKDDETFDEGCADVRQAVFDDVEQKLLDQFNDAKTPSRDRALLGMFFLNGDLSKSYRPQKAQLEDNRPTVISIYFGKPPEEYRTIDAPAPKALVAGTNGNEREERTRE